MARLSAQKPRTKRCSLAPVLIIHALHEALFKRPLLSLLFCGFRICFTPRAFLLSSLLCRKPRFFLSRIFRLFSQNGCVGELLTGSRLGCLLRLTNALPPRVLHHAPPGS